MKKIVEFKESANKEREVKADYIEVLKALYHHNLIACAIKRYMSTRFEDIYLEEKFKVRIFYLKHLAQEKFGGSGCLACHQQTITNYLEKQGFRAAYFKEMLATLYAYPELKKFPLVAFGTAAAVVNDSDDYISPLSTVNAKGEWMIDDIFLDNIFSIGNKIDKIFFLGVKL